MIRQPAQPRSRSAPAEIEPKDPHSRGHQLRSCPDQKRIPGTASQPMHHQDRGITGPPGTRAVIDGDERISIGQIDPSGNPIFDGLRPSPIGGGKRLQMPTRQPPGGTKVAIFQEGRPEENESSSIRSQFPGKATRSRDRLSRDLGEICSLVNSTDLGSAAVSVSSPWRLWLRPGSPGGRDRCRSRPAGSRRDRAGTGTPLASGTAPSGTAA